MEVVYVFLRQGRVMYRNNIVTGIGFVIALVMLVYAGITGAFSNESLRSEFVQLYEDIARIFTN